jgi:hypothetical protein
VAVQILLDAAAALVQGVAGEAEDMKGIHDRDRVGEFLSSCSLEPGEASIATTSS